jgi:hypothetical protein
MAFPATLYPVFTLNYQTNEGFVQIPVGAACGFAVRLWRQPLE